MAETFYPTVCFGFSMLKDKSVLHQMYVDQWGHSEWRPVPMIELGKRNECVADTVPENKDIE